MLRLLIRCDANQRVGLGHFSRCLNIARSLKESNPNIYIKFCGEFNKFSISLLSQNNISYIFSPENKYLIDYVFDLAKKL